MFALSIFSKINFCLKNAPALCDYLICRIPTEGFRVPRIVLNIDKHLFKFALAQTPSQFSPHFYWKLKKMFDPSQVPSGLQPHRDRPIPEVEYADQRFREFTAPPKIEPPPPNVVRPSCIEKCAWLFSRRRNRKFGWTILSIVFGLIITAHIYSIGACRRKSMNNILNFKSRNEDCKMQKNDTFEGSTDYWKFRINFFETDLKIVFLSRMSFQWQFVAAILYVELGITLLLCLRPISSKWWSSLFKSGIAKKISSNGFVFGVFFW